MTTRDDVFLQRRGIDAFDADRCSSYLFVPGQLVVTAEHRERIRSDLERRGLLGDGAPSPTGRRAVLDPGLAMRVSKRLAAPAIADLVRACQQEPSVVEEPGLGQDPRAEAVLEELGLGQIRLAANVDVPELVAAYRAEGLAVAPNHVLVMEGFWEGNPDDLPQPADEIAPPEGDGGTGPRVVILDTGIQKGWQDDPWFRDRVKAAGGSDLEVLDADRDGALDLQAGHGTFIASLVAMGCPTASIVPRRVLNSFGLTSDVDLAAAILAIAELTPDLLVLSLGCYAADDRPPPAVEAALAHLPDRTVVVAAAGNAGQSRVFWPAAMKTVVAVGAHDGGEQGHRRADFSNFGWWVDACADGVDVHAKFVEWDGGVQGVLEPGDFAGWAEWSGTSFSAPVVAGRLAQHMVDTGGTAEDAVRALVRAPGLPSLVQLGAVVD